MDQYFIRIWFRVFFGLGLLCTSLPLCSQSKETLKSFKEGSDPAVQLGKDVLFRVGVEEVRLDAVVLDKKGRQIADLTADDFEIYQDKKQQQVIASRYISDYQPIPLSKRPSSKEPKAAAPIPPPRLTRDAVRRTIVFLVDDFSMKRIEEVHRARLCLRKYVELQMQPGDLVAILQTYRGTSSLSSFTSDKRALLARIDNIHWKAPYYAPVRISEEVIPQPVAIDFCIRALKDMPGRKFLMLMSMYILDYAPINKFFEKMADLALRSGVVIHTLDILGLANPFGDTDVSRFFPQRSKDIMAPWTTDRQYAEFAVSTRQRFNTLPLSKKTGGLILTGNNFFINGIAALEEEMKGYYLLSYMPPESTFGEKNRNKYEKVKVKVKRPGSRVHTRDGFIAHDRPPDSLEDKRDPLIRAMFSPFRFRDLDVSMASGYVEDSPKGYQLRAWVYLDGKALGIENDERGNHSVFIDAVAAILDIDGNVRESAKRQLKLSLNDSDVAWIRAHGLKFSLSLYKDKPGAYYVRTAIKDRVSGFMGSAYEFLEIPDLKNGSLSLSSIVILNNTEDKAWVQAEPFARSQAQPDQAQSLDTKSQALRKYRFGESFDYMTVVYNAKTREGTPPDLESQVVLFKDGIEIYKSEIEPVRLASFDNFRRIPIKKSLLLENTMQPGDYVLKLQVQDKQAKGKNSFAEQFLQFEVSTN